MSFFHSQNTPKSMSADPAPSGGAYSASSDPLAGFKGAASR